MLSIMFDIPFNNEIKVKSELADKLNQLIQIYKNKMAEQLEKELLKK